MNNIKQFDVVELTNGNKAIILKAGSSYSFAEIVNKNGDKVESRNVYNNEISRIVYSRK